jgi:hypothetical protein
MESWQWQLAGIPADSCQLGRLASIGLNHWSIDAGGGYTYFNVETGR